MYYLNGPPCHRGRSPGDGANGTVNDKNVGACGYGRISTSSFPYALITATTKAPPLDMFTGECGACYEIACRGAPIMRNSVPTDICSQQSVIVQVTDACPCGT